MPCLLPFLLVSIASAGEKPVEKPITKDERAHWAFVAPKRPAIPAAKLKSWPRNPIDAFILDTLESNNLKPAPEADRPILLRRLTFDLTGLPPTPQELDAFLDDRSIDAYERVVDRLLTSPRYGERWAQHWLDLARYADSDGFEFDQARPDAWRFRDWVVMSLNDDVPYDRFARLQLAGDEVEPAEPSALIATGFNRCYPDMVDLNDQALRRHQALSDITDTTGLVFLGLTIGCARCHDHKFDPLRLTDYYRLQAFFTPARFRDDLTVASPAERAAYESKRSAWERALAQTQAAILEIEAPAYANLNPARPPGLDDETIAAFEKAPGERSPREIRMVYEARRKDRRIKADVLESINGRTTLLSKLKELTATEPPKPPQARGLDEPGPTAGPTFVRTRGDFASKGPEVGPGFPAVLRPEASQPEVPISPLPRSTGRRKALGEWLTREGHPLTSRVMVNRLWQHHFGKGVVATPSDFGTMGQEPTHPELLDWLATEFESQGWDIKAMHRLMVTSATYRQSSKPSAESLASDPENTLLSHFRRTRLDGEAIRDALLAVSGQLSTTIGGPPVFPELPVELTKLSSKGQVWPVSKTEEERSRRSLYVFVRRNLRYPFFEAFDRPDTNASCPRRTTSTIAPQALTLMNSQIAIHASETLAARVIGEGGADKEGRIRAAFRLAFGRSPDHDEAAMARGFLDRDSSPAHLCLALLNANEFVYVD